MQILPIPAPMFIINVSSPRAAVIMRTPVLRDWYGLAFTENKAEYARYLTEKYGDGSEIPFTETTAAEFIENYTAALKDYRKANADVMMIPQKRDYSLSNEDENGFPNITEAQNYVYRYSGLDFERQQDMIVTEYWTVLADAVKAEYSRTEKGREYLEDAYIDMEIAALREKVRENGDE